MNFLKRAPARVGACALAAAVALVVSGAPAMAQAVPARTGAGSGAQGVTHEQNPRVPDGASWTEAYFPSADNSGVVLHADVLRPADLPANAKTPVIMSIGPYFAHAGQENDEGWAQAGPSARFDDFIDGAQLMKRHYTYVMVDLRGFGGSTGCLDWVGPGEQADVKAAIQWSAGQRWSTGKVGMYGKSYDAVTGLVGNDLKMPSLKAVVAQEPVWDMYNYLFSNGVPRPNVTGTPAAYNSIATIPPMADDSARYKAAAEYEASHPNCLSDNITNNNQPDHDSAYWRARDLAAHAAGTNTPLFITQGFIEPNTKPEDVQQYLTNHHGRERGWMGQWEHVRGNDVENGQLAQGRAGWFDEVMRFYDQYLKGVKPTVTDPPFAIEDSTGHWRAQKTWPVSSTSYDARLTSGSYVDSGAAATASPNASAGRWDMEHAPRTAPLSAANTGATPSAAAAGSSYWVWSTPAQRSLRLTATPRMSFTAGASGNVSVRLWDVAPDGTATMFDEQVSLVKHGGVAFDLKSTDWTFAPGHRLGVQIGTITSRGWRDTPSNNTIAVSNARLGLSVLDTAGDAATQGGRSPYLDQYLSANTTKISDVGTGSFPLTASGKG